MTISKKSSPMQSILEYVGAADDPDALAAYNAIFGIEGPIVDLSIANHVRMSAVRDAVVETMTSHLSQNGQEWGLQVTRLGVVAGSSAEIDVPEVRKQSRIYTQAGVDAITAVVPSPVPLSSDPNGFGIALDSCALVFGPGAESLLQRAELKARPRRKDAPRRTSICWQGPDEADELKAALTRIFRPSLINGIALEGISEAPVSDEWKRRSACRKRGFVTLMMRSMLPLKKSLSLVGESRSLVVGAIAAAEGAMKKAQRDSKPCVHPDGLPHFWFRELRRLGLDDISVPLVKLR